MAHEISHDDIEIDARQAEKMHEAMDYAQHRATWDTFTNLVKWSIGELILIVLALYCFIQAGAFWGGALFIVIAIAAPLVAAFMRSTR